MMCREIFSKTENGVPCFHITPHLLLLKSILYIKVAFKKKNAFGSQTFFAFASLWISFILLIVVDTSMCVTLNEL